MNWTEIKGFVSKDISIEGWAGNQTVELPPQKLEDR